MRGAEPPLLSYFLLKLFLCAAAAAHLSPNDDNDLIIESELNGSRTGGDSEDSDPDQRTEGTETPPPHTEDKCLGYYDVMGQWDPPFVCVTGSYLYCCGTCGFRFCCAFTTSRLDQTTCKNYDTPPWMMTGGPPQKTPKKAGAAGAAAAAGGDAAAAADGGGKVKTSVVVYVVCGLVAVLALAGVFTRLALEKTRRRPQRDHMQRVLAQVIRHPAPADPSDVMGLYGQHYENLATRTTVNHLQFNNVEPGSMLLAHPYPALAHIPSPYEEERPGSDLSSYATLKAVAEKSNETLYGNRHLLEMATKGNLPMVDLDEPEPSNPYSPLKRSSTNAAASTQNGHKSRSSKTHSSSSSLGAHYGTTTTTSSNISSPSAARPDVLKGWDGRYSGHRYAHTQKKHSHSAEKELHTIRYNVPPQPYFVTNSKTEVTV
ncbi:Protein shisa-9B [Merluccius polli]|uniref:Protein shisa-9B n=1 Tax=Merluccius polli TaxID=89951 RepID=A0AA47P8Q3_MERPO|nr:Protein shisa-9B [Merluccius polli]